MPHTLHHSEHKPNRRAPSTKNTAHSQYASQASSSQPHGHSSRTNGFSNLNISALHSSYMSEDPYTSSTGGRAPTGLRRGSKSSKDTGLTPGVENMLMSPGLLMTSPYPFGRTPNGECLFCDVCWCYFLILAGS